MDKIDHEYDHFGPWLLQVKSLDDIPHQYFEYQDLIITANYCFKVPVKEDRRNMHPGTLLYNKVIIINNDRILQLSVINDQISTVELRFQDVQYIVHRGDLLDCEITLFTNQNSLSIQYNLVSMDLAGTVIHLLREYVCPRGELSSKPEMAKQKYSDRQIYSYFRITEKEQGALEILDYQPCFELGLLASNKFFNVYQNITKYRLLDCMFMNNGIELIIANRGKDVVENNETNYKFGHTFIPLKHISKVYLKADDIFKELQQVIFDVGSQQVQIKVGQDFSIKSLENLIETSGVAHV